jgi:hypothetical protein
MAASMPMVSAIFAGIKPQHVDKMFAADQAVTTW